MSYEIESENVNPPCTYCLKPGTLNLNGFAVVPGAVFYFCVNPACTAPTKPHNWWVRPNA
jgi:hypothetical protein